MNKKQIITAIESDNDGYLVITVKGKNADKVAEVIRKVLDAENKESCTTELLDMLEESLMWHHGDKWRDGDSEQRAKWDDRKLKIENLIAKAKGEIE